jgi:hypothetical protein
MIFVEILFAQQFRLAAPALFANVYIDSKNNLFIKNSDGGISYLKHEPVKYSLKKFQNCLIDTDKGLNFDIKDTNFNGLLFLGFYTKNKYSKVEYFSKKHKITKGKSFIDIKNLFVEYDSLIKSKNLMINSVYKIVKTDGTAIYEGKINIKKESPFADEYYIVSGPYVNCVTYSTSTISFETNKEIATNVVVNNKTYKDTKICFHHEFEIKDLMPDSTYEYKIQYSGNSETYNFRTALMKGADKPFVFAYVSDSRANNSSKEKNIYGTNASMVNKIMNTATAQNAAFVQFSGDLIDGYSDNIDDFIFQLTNFKLATEPFSHFIPLYTTMGNHESVYFNFDNNIRVPKFPIMSQSAEVNFAKVFVNPENGPISEDNSKYDIDKVEYNFPPYRENVYYYIYGNTAMIVLNSDYWYSPSKTNNEIYIDGNIHGYIMDNQFEWLKSIIHVFEKDSAIKNIFVTMHTPIFPNGVHLSDAMWYNGDNKFRPSVAGKNADKGIIERRDELLDIICNKSTKTIAILTGDEHNYCRTFVDTIIPMYPENYKGEKIKLKRHIWQINNGSGGAPFHNEGKPIWSSYIKKFAAENTLVFFYINGKKVKLQAINPETLEVIDDAVLR